jgi:thiol:disulfide interchange protein
VPVIRCRPLLKRRSLGTLILTSLTLVVIAGSSGTAATEELHWRDFDAHAYDAARASGRPFVIEFAAEWCRPCKEMEERTFKDPAVVKAAKGMTFLAVDMTTNDQMTQLILESFGVVGAPTTLFFGPDGKEWKRTIGFVGPTEFAELLDRSWRGTDRSDPTHSPTLGA